MEMFCRVSSRGESCTLSSTQRSVNIYKKRVIKMFSLCFNNIFFHIFYGIWYQNSKANSSFLETNMAINLILMYLLQMCVMAIYTHNSFY